jgi:SAM-dependent methyltransferase
MKRQLQPELLDELPPSDPAARRSRADLRRVNAWMDNAGILARALLETQRPPRRIVEIGAGDGTLLLKMAGTLSRSWKNVGVVLVDRQSLVTAKTLEQFRQLGWSADAVEADVFEWLETGGLRAGDLVAANLFLHHFEENRLLEMFEILAEKADSFAACEPRRSAWAETGARLLGLLGCNQVTRHDAVVSVRAGFDGSELSSCWPGDGTWNLHEKRAGLFSHYFQATRKDPDAPV